MRIAPEPIGKTLRFFYGDPGKAPPFVEAGEERIWTIRRPMVFVATGLDWKLGPIASVKSPDRPALEHARDLLRSCGWMTLRVGINTQLEGPLGLLPVAFGSSRVCLLNQGFEMYLGFAGTVVAERGLPCGVELTMILEGSFAFEIQ